MKLILLLCIVGLFAGCSSDEITGKTEAEVLYKEALDYFERSRFLLATEKLGQLKSQYPYSFFATHAELLQADILFKQGNFVEAAAAYLLFRDSHPKHKRLGYVTWRIAESYYNQLPSTYDRDLSSASEAVKYYNEVIRRFPGTEHAGKSNDRIIECSLMLEQKEQYIADFYFKTGVYDAARFRYLDILKNIKNDSIIEHSKLRVVESSFYMESFSDCVRYSQSFGRGSKGSSVEEYKGWEVKCRKKFLELVSKPKDDE